MQARHATLALLAALAGCVSAPFEPDGVRTDLAPVEAASAPQRAGERVIWGGMVIEVVNRAESSEIVVLGYPLDSKQRPLLKQPTVGRFIAVVPGYVEPFDFPQGRFVTLRGSVSGAREALIDERPYVYPVLAVEDTFLWPQNFQNAGPRFSIGIGVSR